MGSPVTMGLDLGGGGVRCVLLGADSGERWQVARPWAFETAPGTGGLGVDLPLDLLWQRVGEAARAALAAAGAAPESVAGVAVAAMRFASVVLDAAGEAVLAVPNRDARAAGEGLRLAAEHGEAIHGATGLWPLPIHASARLLWLRQHDPAAFERAHTLLSLSDWLNFRLCGERVSDFSQAGSTGLFDLARRDWSDAVLRTLDLPRALLPAVRASGERIGALGDEAARHLGLAAGTTVALGAGDTRCGLLGSGAVAPGDVGLVAGTTAPIERVADAPLRDAEGRLRSGFHAVPGLWVLEANLGPMGETLSWIARLLHPESSQPEERFLAEAASATPGAAGLLSTLGVQIQDDRAPSLPIGQLTLSHQTGVEGARGRAHLARATAEGYACGVRANLAELERASGVVTDTLHLSGGMARSDFFAQLVADVTGAAVARPAFANSTGLGAALCAGVGAGLWRDLPSAARACAGEIARFAPDGARHESYRRSYQCWRDLRNANHGALASIATGAVLPFSMQAAARAARPAAPLCRPKMLVTAAFDDASVAKLRALGEVEYKSFRDHMQLLSGRGLVEALGDREVFVTEVDVVDAAALAQLPALRVIAACRGDAVNVDVEACTAFGVPVLYAPGRNADAVADLTVAFLLSLARRLPAATRFLADPEVSAGNLGKMGQAFRSLQGYELWQKTVGLVGLGAVGRGVAKRLAGFGVRLLVADPYVSREAAALAGCEKVELGELLRESDFVSLHAAVSDETRGLLGAAELAAMKPGSFLVNTARAALVDEPALIDALERGHLAGAALDTFHVEPPGHDHPLIRHGSVIHTPHVGGNTNEIATHQGRQISEALEQLIRGETPRCVRNPEALEGFSWSGPRREPGEAELARLAERTGPAVTDLQRDARAEAAQAEDLSSAAAPAEIVEKMRALLEAFTARLAGDAAIAAKSEGQDVALYFVLPDVGLDLHLALRDGRVASALGRPEGGSLVALRMRAEILDGMFTGRINAVERAMQGDIAFTGDAGKAMAIQQLQGDLQRLYSAAREEVGDPGDLASLAAPGAEKAAGAPAPVAESDVRVELVRVTRELFEAQLITATGGNVSVRIPGQEDQVWITPSQLFKGDLSPEVLVRITLDGESLDPGARSPSSEWSMHTRILKKKPEAVAVIHAHAPHATTLANAGLDFVPISTEAAFFGNLPRVPFIMPGTDDLAEAVSEAMRESWAVLMINHGLVVCGRSLRRAADMAEIIERSCELILGCLALGKEPPVLPEKAVKTLRAMGDLVA